MNVFYFCNGQDETCSKEGCHKNGGHCCHTIDRAFARETEGVRLFEELHPDELFEIDPEDIILPSTTTDGALSAGRSPTLRSGVGGFDKSRRTAV